MYFYALLGRIIGHFGKLTESEMLRRPTGVPDIRKELSMGSKNADMPCSSSNKGPLSPLEVLKIIGDSLMARVESAIGMAMFRDRVTKITTRSLDNDVRPYMNHGNRPSHLEQEELY